MLAGKFRIAPYIPGCVSKTCGDPLVIARDRSDQRLVDRLRRVVVRDAIGTAFHPLRRHRPGIRGQIAGREPVAERHRKPVRRISGKQREAIQAVPDELVDAVSLVGPKERIRDRLEAWRESPVTTLMVGSPQPEALQVLAELVL